MNGRIQWRDLEEEMESQLIRDGELATAASKDEEEENSAFVQAMRPVNLEGSRYAEYEGFFFPSKEQSGASKARNYMIPVLESLSEVTSNINLFFNFMRSCMQYANQISHMAPEERAAYVNDILARAIERKRSSESVGASVAGFLIAVRSAHSTFHNVYRSGRYTDGVDIVMSGMGKDSQDSPVMFGSYDAKSLSANMLPSGNPSNYDVSRQRSGNWQSPMGEAIIAAAKEINAYLFGTTAVSERTQHKAHSVNTRFSDLAAIFTRHTGIRLEHELLTDLVTNNDLAEQFLQVEMMKMPSQQAEQIATFTRRNELSIRPEDKQAVIENRMNDPLRVAPEPELLNVVVRSTIRFTLENDVACFISQTPIGERPNLSRINNWFSIYVGQFLRAKASRKVSNVATISMGNIPRYVMGASTVKKISDIRTQNGFVVEKTRANADGMYIRPDGTMSTRPDIDAIKQSKLAEEYEKLSEEFLELLSRNDIPFQAFKQHPRMDYWPHVNEHDVARLNEIQTELKSYEGVVIGYDWDFGVSITATGMPGGTITEQENGSVTPDALSIADYLGYNLAPEGQTPMVRKFANTMYMLTTNRNQSMIETESHRMFGSADGASTFARSEIVKDIVKLYFQLAYLDNKAPKLPEILSAAMRALKYEQLPQERTNKDYTPEYLTYLNNDGTIRRDAMQFTRDLPVNLLAAAMELSAGKPNSRLWDEVYQSIRTPDRIPKPDEIREELENHPDYFDSSMSRMADFPRLFNFLGGQVFKQILDAVNAVPLADHMNAVSGKAKAVVGKHPYNDSDLELEFSRLPNSSIMDRVMPYAIMLGKYAPNHETIFAQADEQVESIRPVEGFDAEDIKVPGLVNNDKNPRSVFPHQRDTQAYLRKGTNSPAFAVIALEPGGGKTGQGIIDFSCLAQDMLEVGTNVRPLVICPNGLVGTWAADLEYFMGESWNVFPITADVMSRWKQERLLEAALAAPPNTLFVCSMTFIQGKPMRLCIGNARLPASANLEFIKRLNCNYIAIDESHNLKNFTSARHKAVKALTTSSNVKWLRILSGTLMPDRAKDIEGQIALYSPHIFRKGEIEDASERGEDDAEQTVIINGRVISTYTPLNAERAVAKLSLYCPFIVKKRKEWAWMLPSPIENFYAVPMIADNDSGTDPDEIEQQKLHEQLYATVLKDTVEEVEKLVKQKQSADKAAAKKRKGGDDEEDEDGEDGGSSDDKFTDNDEDFAGENIQQALWEKNLARLERLLIAPQFDEAFDKVFGEKGKNFKSRKAKFIANLAVMHFNPPTWQRDKLYKEYELCEYKGKLYVPPKYDKERADHVLLPASTKGIPPSELEEYWKEEAEGKLIIITRYNKSARAVFEALDPEYQRKAVLFTGDEPNKQKAFNDFKTDPKVKILIANEQGMSEGHNLQMASRIIRAESPWGPGALNQTSARIFRPDPKGATSGKLARDVIYLDWVVTDNSMEIPKLCRVISKSFSVAKFTEANNPRYQQLFQDNPVPSDREEPALGLGVEMLKNIRGLRDQPFSMMREAYHEMNNTEAAEFRDLRLTQEAAMLPITPMPNVAGAARMQHVPLVPNQKIADPNGWLPITAETLLREDDVRNNVEEKLIKMPVFTEYGYGRIVGVYRKKNSKEISSVRVRLKNPPPGIDEVKTVQLDLAFVMTGTISPADFAKHFDVPLYATQTEQKKGEREAARKQKELEEQEAQEERERQIRERQERKTIRIIKKEREDADKREANTKAGRPKNEGIYETPDAVININPPAPKGKATKIVVSEEDDTISQVVDADKQVDLLPAYYHGFATLEAIFDEESSVDLKKFGFKEMGPYAYVEVSNKKRFHQVYEYLYDNFNLSDKTSNIIREINRAFEPGKTNTNKLWYKLELAPVSELPSFFSLRKRVVEDRKEVRVYPVFTHDHVMLCIDIRTNPAIVKHIGKSIPGAATKWKRSPGHWFYFGRNKTDLKAKIAEVKKAGYDVTNEKSALKELAEINFKVKTR